MLSRRSRKPSESSTTAPATEILLPVCGLPGGFHDVIQCALQASQAHRTRRPFTICPGAPCAFMG